MNERTRNDYAHAIAEPAICCHRRQACEAHSHQLAHADVGDSPVHIAAQFWTSSALTAPVGFLAARPVNGSLLREQTKVPCH